MFFILSKILGLLASPAMWVVLLLLLALALPDQRRGRQLVRACTLALLFIFNNYTTGLVWNAWCPSPVPIAGLQHFHAAIVLGGLTDMLQQPKDRVYLNDAVDRVMHPLALAHQGQVDMLIVSGGSGLLQQGGPSEAATVLRMLRATHQQLPPIVLEEKSRNTYENARNTKVVIDSLVQAGQLPPQPRLLLCTSAFHMARAQACFRKQGLYTQPFPADFRLAPKAGQWDHLFQFRAYNAYRWEILLHEWIGFLSYSLAGYV